MEQSTSIPKQPWWRISGLRRLVFWQSTILVTQMTVGYDESVVGSLQAMPTWLEAMGSPNASMIGLITTVVFIGGFVGAFFAGPFADAYGRRQGLFFGSSLAVAGAIIQTAAHNVVMFICGRLIIGIGISFTCVAGPSLLNELAHPDMRGTIASLFNVLWYVGSIIAAWTTFGTSHMESSSWSWRIPSLLQGIPALAVMIAILLGLPESPRYLCAKGRTGEARALLAKYHCDGDANAPLIEQEISEMEAAIQADKLASQMKWNALYASPANRKKLGIVISVSLLTLWNGQGVISYYFSPILTSIGITGATQQTGINGGMQIWNLLCAITGALLADRVGRRPLWLGSFLGMIVANVALTISSAMYVEHSSKAAGYASVVLLFFYNAAFNLACNPLLYCYPTEILPFAIRARGLSVMIAVSQAALTVNQYVNPVALESIGYYYYIFYLGMLLIGTVLIYFTFPETKGRTLEELAHLFEESTMVDTFGVPVEADDLESSAVTAKTPLEKIISKN